MSELTDKPKGPLVWFDMDCLRGRIEPRLRHVEDKVVSSDFDEMCNIIVKDYGNYRDTLVKSYNGFQSEKSKFDREWLA